jgi:adenylyltransferase/sulfurtransferase
LNGSHPSIKGLIDYDEFCSAPSTVAGNKDSLHRDNPYSPVMEITPAEFEELKKSGEPYELIDVRSEAEYAISNHGGTLVPLETILDNADRFRDNKKYIFHCMTGSRSAKAITSLQEIHGLRNLYNLRF